MTLNSKLDVLSLGFSSNLMLDQINALYFSVSKRKKKIMKERKGEDNVYLVGLPLLDL